MDNYEKRSRTETYTGLPHVPGDVIETFADSGMFEGLKLVVAYDVNTNTVDLSHLKVDESGKLVASLTGGVENTFRFRFIRHLDTEEFIDALARYFGPDGSEAFEHFREIANKYIS